MTWTQEASANYVNRKKRLTQAVIDGNPVRIIEECNAAIASFEKLGYPDDWSRWDRARYDALANFNRNFGRAW